MTQDQRIAAIGLRVMSGDTAPPGAHENLRRNLADVPADLLQQVGATIAAVSEDEGLALIAAHDDAAEAGGQLLLRPDVQALLLPSAQQPRDSDARAALLVYAIGFAFLRLETIRDARKVDA